MTQGAMIKQALSERGITIRDLGNRINIPYSSLTKMLGGVYNVSDDNLKLICEGINGMSESKVYPHDFNPSYIRTIEEFEKDYCDQCKKEEDCKRDKSKCYILALVSYGYEKGLEEVRRAINIE